MSSLEASLISQSSDASRVHAAPSDGVHSAAAGHLPVGMGHAVATANDSLDQYLPKALQQYAVNHAAQDSAHSTGGQMQITSPSDRSGRPSVSEWIASLTPEQQHELHQQGLLDRAEVDASLLQAMRAADDFHVGARSGNQASQAPQTPPLGAYGAVAITTAGASERNASVSHGFLAESASSTARRGEWEGGHSQRRLKAMRPDQDASGGYLPTGVLQGLSGDEAGMRRRRRVQASDTGEERVFSAHGGMMVEGERAGRAWDSRHGTTPDHRANHADHPTHPRPREDAVPQHAILPSRGVAAGSTALYLASLGAGGRTDVELSRQADSMGAREMALQHVQVQRLQAMQRTGETLSDRGASSPPLDGLPQQFRESM